MQGPWASTLLLPVRPGNAARSCFVLITLLAPLASRGVSQTTPAPPVTSSPPATAPAKPPANQSASTPVLEVSSDEVSLDLVVRDKKHRSILDLKPADIAVTDDGAPVKISALHLVSGKSTDEHWITLVFDRLDASSARTAHDTAIKVLKMIPASGFIFAVMSVDNRLRLVQEYTADRGLLSKAIATATSPPSADTVHESALAEKNLIAIAQTVARPSATAASTEEHRQASVLMAAMEGSQRIVQDQHANPSLASLEAICQAQRNLPGRKVVLYFAHGLQPNANTNDRIQSIIGTANKAGENLYVVDGNALDPEASKQMQVATAMGNFASSAHMISTPSMSAPITGPGQAVIAPGMAAMITNAPARASMSSQSAARTPLGRLANGTGGAYLDPGENLKKPLRIMIEDMTTYYEASYVPAAEDYDGRFRAVAIKPLRAGLVIHSRTGYFSLPPAGSSGIQPFEAPLLKVLSGPALPSEISFRSQILHMGSTENGNSSELVVEVPIASLEMRKDANTNLFSVHLAMVAQIKDHEGKVVEHFSEDIPRHGSLNEIEAVKSEVITLQRHFTEAPGDYVLEAAILDRNSGQYGAQRTDFQVAGSPEGLSISDIALVRRTDPMSDEADLLEPLMYSTNKGNARVVPDLSGQIAPQARDISLFFILHPDPHAADAARLEMEVLKDEKPMAHMPLQLRGNGKETSPYLGSIHAESFPAGRYELEITGTQDGKSVSRDLSFSITGPEVASTAPGPGPGPDKITSSESTTVSDLKGSYTALPVASRNTLIITSPASPIAAPAPQQREAILEGARQRALSYSTSLPNFSCVEVTNRSVDSSGNGQWKHKDTIAELLRYRDNQETRLTLEVNGRRSDADREELKGVISKGEFGGVLSAVFAPSAKADFEWKETVELSGELAQVFTYRVALANSTFNLTGENGSQLTVGFHGQVYIDSATHSVRRITLEADVPPAFSIHSTSIDVDYQFVAINAHDYLMPVRATMALQQGRRESELNEIDFRDYRRFGSQVRMLGFSQTLDDK